MKISHLLIATIILLFSVRVYSCTNLLVTKGASKDSATYLVYLNDGEWLYKLNRTPAKEHNISDSIVYKSITGKKFKIHQVKHTNAIIGFQMNEYQLAIGETTFMGTENLWDKDMPLKYWELMKLALLRAKTAREAIDVITLLVEQYGYGSEGESFSIVDPNEAWVLEMIGTGGKGGAVWVACKVPDGMIAAHANHSRIGTFPLNDPDNCIYSENVISFAVQNGYYNENSGEAFEFNKAYDPSSTEHIKYSESRVWSIYNRAAPSLNLSINYNRGMENSNRYPLFITPDNKLSIQDVFSLVRDHYEGTELDMTTGIDAGPFGNPNRVRPLSWTIDSTKYSWERAISTYNTAFSYVAQLRNYLPDEIGGITWFGVDDTYTSCYFPIYCSVTDISKPFATGDINNYSRESAWWAFNFAANYANSRYSNISADIIKEQKCIEDMFISQQDSIENIAMVFKGDERIDYLTKYSVSMGNLLHERWVKLGDRLVTKYNDGYIKDDNNAIKSKGYPESWLKTVIENQGDKHLID
jgi:dipeptidase